MSQWGFYLDQTRCIGCKTCILACQAWNEDERGDATLYPDLSWERGMPRDPVTDAGHQGNDEVMNRYRMKEQYRHVYATEYGTWPQVDVSFWTVSCAHCDNPACVAVCPVGHLFKEPEHGIVMTDKNHPCIGCTLCAEACPFGAPQYYDDPRNHEEGEKPKMKKCDLCVDRIGQGDKPACVAGCRMRALDAGPIEELRQKYPGAAASTQDALPDVSQLTNEHVRPNLLYKRKILRIKT